MGLCARLFGIWYDYSMKFKVDFTSADPSQANEIVSPRCPACKQKGTFESVGGSKDIRITPGLPFTYLGQRRCPNPDCHSHVFVAIKTNVGQREILISYPAERIDFDTTDVPTSIIESLEEAITCHANGCFVASAIMVRKTLEELCRERNASGSNLKDRIRSLGNLIILPPELLNGLDDLRLLGNDAAHIESQQYAKVGQDEVEVGIELTKEVLKAVYQYAALLSRLRAFKKQT